MNAWIVGFACLAAAATGRAQGTDTTHAAPAAAPVGAPPGAPTLDSAAPARDTTAPMGPADSAIQRAQSLVAQGHTDEGRSLVDSVLTVAPPGSLTYASALYARASLATNADSAEEDYRRITVEYATSPRAADALLRLAQLELARGDRAQAADHLARLTREQLAGQTGITYARTELQVGLAYFDLQDAAHACAALVGARTAAPATDVELRNRIDYNIQRCPRSAFEPTPGPATTTPPTPTSVATRDSAHRAATRVTRAKGDSSARRSPSTTPAAAKAAAVPSGGRPSAPVSATPKPPSPPAPPPPARSATTPSAGAAALETRHGMPGYTVQVAAYPTRAAADTLAAHLRDRGYETRVWGVAAPFRVRVGRYTTEASADAVQSALKAKGIVGFVTAAEPVAP
jgi:cell division septation protein DedD